MSPSATRLAKRPLILAISLIALCVLVVDWPMLFGGRVPITGDTLSLLYPINTLTGELLRSGNLPVWNVHQMSGMPLLGDPQAGWGSLPTMLAYALFPMARGTAVTLAAQLALAALGTLLFLRSTGVSLAGATVAALSYALGGYGYFIQSNLVILGAHAWLPWLLLGADVGVRHRGRRRLAGWTLAGFAASQELSTWFGQGAYYAFAATAVYVTFLTLLGPPAQGRPWPERVKELVLQSLALSAFGLGLSAWTLFPRLELLLSSSLRTGYTEGAQQFAGGASPTILLSYFNADARYAGVVAILSLLASMLLGPSRTQVFYALACTVTFVSSLSLLVNAATTNPVVRAVLGLVPGVNQLHLHFPGRIATVYLFFGAALAGSTFDRLLCARGRQRLTLPIAAGGALLLLVGLTRSLSPLGNPAYRVFLLALAAMAIVVALVWRRRLPVGMGAILLVLLTATELVYTNTQQHFLRASLERPEEYYNAPEILESVARLKSTPEQGRFLGYYPERLPRVLIDDRRGYWLDPSIRELLMTAQATVHGLRDVQGFNPLHLASYDKLLRVANGKDQIVYRNAYVLQRGKDSPLVDMLNVRYILAREGVKLGGKYRRVPGDEGPWLYENTRALPRAWTVHGVAVHDDDTALRLIHTGKLNPKQVAAVPRTIQGIAPAQGTDEVVVERYAPNEIRLNARLSAAGLVVLSELDYPAWKVRVNGKPAAAVRANGALRAVQVPAGKHTVTWYYDSTPTRVGFLISAASAISIVALLLLWPRLASRRPGWFRRTQV